MMEIKDLMIKNKRKYRDIILNEPPKKKLRGKQRFVECYSMISSLDFHSNKLIFLSSFLDGTIKLYGIDDENYVINDIVTLYHPKYNPNKSKKLSKMIKIKNKLQKLSKYEDMSDDEFNRQNISDISDIDSDIDSDISSVIEVSKDKIGNIRGIQCKQAIFGLNGYDNNIYSNWQDNSILLHDYGINKVIHTKFHKNLDGDITSMKGYNFNLLCYGDSNGIIRVLDKRTFKNTHKMDEHSAGINTIECIFHKNRVFGGSRDGQLSVWDIRKSDKPIKIKKSKDDKKDDIKPPPKCLKYISQPMNDEIMSICPIKYDSKILCGMLSGYINIFKWDNWNTFCDRIKGHANMLTKIIKYDNDCCITACSDGIIRLISITPHKELNIIGNHNLLTIDHMSLSHDKKYLISYANGDNYNLFYHNRTNKPSLMNKFGYNDGTKEYINIWDLNWTPNELTEFKKSQRIYKRKQQMIENLNNLARGIKDFIELNDEDYDVPSETESEIRQKLEHEQEMKKAHDKKMKQELAEVSDIDSINSDMLDAYDTDELLNDNDTDIHSNDSDINKNDDIFVRRVGDDFIRDRTEFFRKIKRKRKVKKWGKWMKQKDSNQRFFGDL